MVEQDAIFTHRDSPAWRKAMELVTTIYGLTQTFPDTERFGLTNQIRRAAVSIACNIAEGKGRLSRSELTYFLGIARGSAYEVATQLEIALSLNYATGEQAETALALAREIVRMLNASLRTLRSRNG